MTCYTCYISHNYEVAMAVLYTQKKIQEALRELAIRPVGGNVTTKEAARILSWRAKHEEGIDHVYPESAVRRHVESENLKIAERRNKRSNLQVLALYVTPHG